VSVCECRLWFRGWLELGNWPEADREFDGIPPALRASREVLRVRFGIYAKARKWEMAYEIASALCRSPEASWMDSYSLARAACQRGKLTEAYEALQRAIDRAGKDIRAMALDDEDLEPLWLDISEV